MLNSLNSGFMKNSRRLGRGHGCSKGKTCGRGHKGQRCRSGGKRYSSRTKQHQVNWKMLEYGFKRGNNNGGHIIKTISLSLLTNRLSSNCKCSIKKLRDMFGINDLCYVKLLDGEITITGLMLECDLASDNAILKITNLGGKINLSNVVSYLR
ncbi:50S ribosomal protein L15 [Candidatus Hodgkinia cicadicola]|uniref:Large ribosomal subunit protein uL15 n=1 Tax=Candidatus Hodgkinia cicadicola TaxID=573658 RepID=A0ABX4MEU1_9HYPH|nr:50S ribosomal protein L15 [Candidatus Hodgkinia cicadicola]PIM96820.1 50S ribosomal protein L15 [Candidatus Hodgkinia cicadicola]